MSAFVLNKTDIDLLTRATAAMLQLNRKYAGSYPLHKETVDLLGKYADDLHSIYRALFIANVKAVNGRYGEDEKTIPKYTPLHPWNTERLNMDQMFIAIESFDCYMYQCAEEPICGSAIYNACYDVFKLLCMVYAKHVSWKSRDKSI